MRRRKASGSRMMRATPPRSSLGQAIWFYVLSTLILSLSMASQTLLFAWMAGAGGMLAGLGGTFVFVLAFVAVAPASLLVGRLLRVTDMRFALVRAALTALLIAFMVVPLIVVGVVSWIFLRAKRREDQAVRDMKEEQERIKWPSEPSS